MSGGGIPGPPRKLQVVRVGTKHVQLSWQAPSSGSATGYRISGRCGGEGDFATLLTITDDIDKCEARVPVSASSWWELRVAALRPFAGEAAGTSNSTGFVVDASRGLILTNQHVVGCGPAKVAE